MSARISGIGLEIDRVSARIYVDGTEAHVSFLEYKMLSFFESHPDHFCTSRQLLDGVWGENYCSTERIVDTHIRKIRKAIGKYGAAIETLYGGGYRFNPKKACP